jgi:hypothetical protein
MEPGAVKDGARRRLIAGGGCVAACRPAVGFPVHVGEVRRTRTQIPNMPRMICFSIRYVKEKILQRSFS